MAGLWGVGGMGGASGWSLPPFPSLSIHWGRNILDVQGRPPLAEGQRGFPLERPGNGGVSGNRTGGKCTGDPVHYGFCTGLSPSLLLGRVEYITILEGSFSYSDTVSRSFWWGRIHHYYYKSSKAKQLGDKELNKFFPPKGRPLLFLLLLSFFCASSYVKFH